MLGRALHALDAVTRGISGAALLAVTFIIFLNATGRFLIGASFLGGEELARLLMVWATFLAAFSALRIEGHVSIDLALRQAGPRLQRLLRGGIAVIGAVICVYLTITSYQLTSFSFGSGQMGATLPVPRALFFLPVCVGAALLTVGFLEQVVRAATGTLPDLPGLSEETVADGAQGVKDDL